MKDRRNRYRSTVSAEQAESILGPFVPGLIAIHRDALSHWRCCLTQIPRLGVDDTMNQARARVISNFISFEVRTKFASNYSVTLTDDSGFLVMVVQDTIAVRFKKLNRRLRPSNILTRQQYDFSTQALLPGFPADATNLTFGHRLNKMGTDFEGFWLQCPRGDRNIWSIPIDRPDDLPLLIGVQPQPLPDDARTPVVRPKRSSNKKAAE